MGTAVYKKGIYVGTLSRTQLGAEFLYDERWLNANARDRIGVGFSMPPRQESYRVSGINLHPMFENLLPGEELLRSLARRLRAQEHDLFTLLTDLGGDTVGDLSFLGEGRHFEKRKNEKFDPKRMSFPEIVEAKYHDLNRDLERIALSGAQPKMSATRVTLSLDGFGQQTSMIKLNADPRFPNACENEHCFMSLARKCGIRAARTKLIYDRDGQSALLIDRFDRTKIGRQVQTLHQEDGCQLLDRYSVDRDHVSTEEVLIAMRPIVASWPATAAECLVRIAFSYAIGNHDHHAKNWSVLEEKPGVVLLSPSYDVLSTLVYGDHFMAIPVNGKDSELTQDDLVDCAKAVDAPLGATMNRVYRTLQELKGQLREVDAIGLSPSLLGSLKREIVDRISALTDGSV